MTRVRESLLLVQWMWRLLVSGLLCVPAVGMLADGSWNDRGSQIGTLMAGLPDNSDVDQSYASAASNPAISLPRSGPTAEPAAAAGRDRTQRTGPELWYIVASKPETTAPAQWELPHRPAIWVPAANQHSGG